MRDARRSDDSAREYAFSSFLFFFSRYYAAFGNNHALKTEKKKTRSKTHAKECQQGSDARHKIVKMRGKRGEKKAAEKPAYRYYNVR